MNIIHYLFCYPSSLDIEPSHLDFRFIPTILGFFDTEYLIIYPNAKYA